MTLVVRLLGDGDQGLLERVEAGVFDRDVDPSLADAFLRDPRHHLVAAIADDRIVGFVSALDYWHPDKPRELWINEVGVTSAWQRRGVGTQLMQATLDHARALGCVEAWVLTDQQEPRSARPLPQGWRCPVRHGPGHVHIRIPAARSVRQPNPPGVRPMRRFGEPPVTGRRYVERPGAYAVVRRRGEMLVVQWQGQLYLPGGGMDAGEGTLAALHRECLEETGWRIRVERRLGAFQRYVYATDLDLWLRKVCHIYLARPALCIGGPAQPGHRAIWMPIKAAATRPRRRGRAGYPTPSRGGVRPPALWPAKAGVACISPG